MIMINPITGVLRRIEDLRCIKCYHSLEQGCLYNYCPKCRKIRFSSMTFM
jgi:Zn finger protein HypA/HybF involved in hydrogenase expression